jgi:hypothetical protein
LHSHLLAHPPFLPPLEKLDVERIGHPQPILNADWPYFAP